MWLRYTCFLGKMPFSFPKELLRDRALNCGSSHGHYLEGGGERMLAGTPPREWASASEPRYPDPCLVRSSGQYSAGPLGNSDLGFSASSNPVGAPSKTSLEFDPIATTRAETRDAVDRCPKRALVHGATDAPTCFASVGGQKVPAPGQFPGTDEEHHEAHKRLELGSHRGPHGHGMNTDEVQKHGKRLASHQSNLPKKTRPSSTTPSASTPLEWRTCSWTLRHRRSKDSTTSSIR